MLVKKHLFKNFSSYEFEFIIVNDNGNFLEIILNRPDKKNALNSKMINELALCTDYANSNDKIRAVVYKSNGDTFCSGLDLKELSKSKIFLADVFNKLHKPKITILNGNVYAGGVLLVSCSNYVICTSKIKMKLPEVKRGLFPFQVMDSLFRIMSEKKVIDWCIRGYELNARECRDLNLVQEICNEEEFEDKLKSIIEEISLGSPNAIKNALKVFEEIYINDQIIKKLNNALDCLKNSDDVIEGVKAFKEKRIPKWN